MEDQNILVLCGNQISIQLLRDLHFYQKLKVILIPEHCEDFYQEVSVMFLNSGVVYTKVTNENYCTTIEKYIIDLKISFGLVFTFSYIIPLKIIELPIYGFFNIHPGVLPNYRGSDPIFRQIVNREKYAGITIHKLDEGIDSGPIVLMERILLDPNDTYGLLSAKLGVLAASQMAVLLKMIEHGFKIPMRSQNESKAMYYDKQGTKEVTINWEMMNANEIIALINACNPWNNGAVAIINQKLVRIIYATKSDFEQEHQFEPGTVLEITTELLKVSTNNKEVIDIHILYMNEGYFQAGKLKYFGINKGDKF